METDTITGAIIAAAEEAYRAFEARTRALEAGGEEYVILKDGYPGAEDGGWILELVYDAHGKNADGTPALLPDDWRYKFARDALAAISDASEDQDAIEVRDEFTEPDIYTHDRLRWLSSHLSRPSYCDEAREEFDLPADLDLVERIGWGQSAEKGEVFDSVLYSLAEHVESTSAQEDDPR